MRTNGTSSPAIGPAQGVQIISSGTINSHDVVVAGNYLGNRQHGEPRRWGRKSVSFVNAETGSYNLRIGYDRRRGVRRRGNGT